MPKVPEGIFANCKECGRLYEKTSYNQKYCDKVCREQAQSKIRREGYRRIHPKQYKPKYITPQRIKLINCIKCGAKIFYQNLCRKCYRERYPHRKYCLFCGVPLNKSEETDSLCRKHRFKMGRVYVIPNMEAPFNEWVWKLEEREKSYILLSAN